MPSKTHQPIAPKRPHPLTSHGVTRVDDRGGGRRFLGEGGRGREERERARPEGGAARKQTIPTNGGRHGESPFLS